MSRLTDFQTLAGGWDRPTHLIDMTPSTTGNTAGYLTVAAQAGPWTPLNGGPEFVHIESTGGSGTSNVVVAVDQTNDPASALAVYDTVYTTSKLASGSPAGDGYTLNSKGYVRVRLVSTTGATASIGATLSR